MVMTETVTANLRTMADQMDKYETETGTYEPWQSILREAADLIDKLTLLTEQQAADLASEKIIGDDVVRFLQLAGQVRSGWLHDGPVWAVDSNKWSKSTPCFVVVPSEDKND